MITCIKTLSYTVHPTEGRSFLYVLELLKQKHDPAISSKACIAIPAGSDVVLCSPLKRVLTSLDTKTRKTVKVREYLREIPFDITQYCTESDWETSGSDCVRSAFITAFEDDALGITRKELNNQMQHFFGECSGYTNPIAVSHSFRMSLIRAYSETNAQLFKEPELLREYVSITQKTFPFGGVYTL